MFLQLANSLGQTIAQEIVTGNNGDNNFLWDLKKQELPTMLLASNFNRWATTNTKANQILAPFVNRFLDSLLSIVDFRQQCLFFCIFSAH